MYFLLIAIMTFSVQSQALELGVPGKNNKEVINLGPAKKNNNTSLKIEPALRIGFSLDLVSAGDMPRSVQVDLIQSTGASVSVGLRINNKIEVGCKTERVSSTLVKYNLDTHSSIYGNKNTCYIAVEFEGLAGEQGTGYIKVAYGELDTTLNYLGYDIYSMTIIDKHINFYLSKNRDYFFLQR